MKLSDILKRSSDKEKRSASITKARAFRVGGYSVLATALVLAIVIAVNIFAGALPEKTMQLDVTSGQLFTISEQTENLLARLEDEVTVYWVVQAGQEDETLGKLLDRYAALGDKLTVEKKDPDVYPTLIRQYTDSVSNNSLIVVCGDRSRYVDYYEIYVYDYSSYYYDYSYDVSFAGESALTSAIDYVTNDELPKLYVLTGHGEDAVASSFQSALEQENIETEELSLLTLEDVPEDADALLIYAPKSDISAEEKDILLTYLQAGGRLLLITDPPEDGALENLSELMAYYGVRAQDGIVIEGNQNHYAWGTPYYLVPNIESHDITAPLIDGGYYILLPIAQGLTVSDDLREGVSVTELLTTSASAFSKTSGYAMSTYEKEADDIDGPFALAAAVTETLEDESETQIVWVSSASLLDEQTNMQVSGGNQDLFLNAVSWLCGETESGVSIHAKSLSYDYLTMSSGTASMLSVLIVGIIPLGYLAAGIYIWVRRKRQ